MSNYDDRKKAWMDLEKTLSPLPKDLAYLSGFNTLKMAVLERIDNDKSAGKISKDDLKNLELKKNKVVGEDPYIFSERLVNVMMHYAYEMGKKEIDKRSFDAGFDSAWADVKKRLGIEVCNCCDGEIE